MASGDGQSLSIRPPPVADQKPKSIADFIARVNAQPGGFRDVTEDKLKEAVEADGEKSGRDDEQEDAVMAGADGNGDDQDEEDDGEDEEDVAQNLDQARMEVLKNIDIAGNTAMLTLDSLSLLLSKQNPTQAGLTLSQQLRDMVGIGTVGTDKLAASNATEAKTEDGEDVALGWTLMEINGTRDAAEEASRFLGRETEAEGRYWEDVVKVHKAGWSVCNVPQERHTLGVRFGFSEAAPDFRNNGLAPMRRSDDGSVHLDCGKLGGVSERLLVTYQRDGQVVGRSALPAQTPDDAPLEARVLEARNTIFAQELWHELAREARSLIAYDVRPDGPRLVCDVDASSKIVLELAPLGPEPLPNDGFPENGLASTISVSLHVLLSYAHRYNELMRIRPLPPHIPRARGQQSYALFRPIISRMASLRNIKQCTGYVGSLVSVLKTAGLPASFTLHTPNLSSSLADNNASSATNAASRTGANKLSAAQTLVRNLLQPIEFTIDLALLSETDEPFTIRGRTFLYPVITTHYHILASSQSSQSSQTHPLQRVCPPFKDGYFDINGLSHYLGSATARLLTDAYLAKIRALPSLKGDWVQGVSGTSIYDTTSEHHEVRFAVRDNPPVLVVQGAASEEADGSGKTREVCWESSDGGEDGTLEKIVGQMVGQEIS